MSNATVFLLFLAVPALADWDSRHKASQRLLKEGRPEEAIAELKLALAETDAKGRVHALDALARAEVRAGQYRSAKRHLEGAAALWPAGSQDQAVVLYNLGRVHLDLQEYARAEEVFTQALAALPRESAVWHSLGQAQFRRKRQDAAEASLRKALSLANRASQPLIASDLAALFEASRKYEKAAAIWREAIALSAPGQARARMLANLAALQWNWNDKSQAAAHFQEALAEMEAAVGPRHPDVARILDDYQEVLRKTGKKAEAVAASERASAIRSAFAHHTNEQGASVDWRDLRR